MNHPVSLRDRKLWTLHLAAGVVVFVFLGLHMVIMHLDAAVGVGSSPGSKPIDWENVAARGKSVFFLVSYVVLLGAALYHGLFGLRTILFELASGAGARRALSWMLLLAGVALFAVGTWAAWASYQLQS